jgi:tRNA-splicing ligase RtcB (3'-phosphate/5'-hydroxy nucleic acid ligase)
VTDLKIYGEHDERTVSQMWRCMGVGSVAGGVLCADGHLGYAQPVGGVIAYEEHVSISGVGFDIACGNMAARINLKYDDIKDRVPVIANDIGKQISFGLGRSNPKPIDHAVFDSPLWDDAGTGHLKQMARAQLGTVGSGNHYVDLFEDEDGYVWIGVHFGSRGLGHKSATHYLKLAGGKDGIDVAPALVAVNSELGQRYLAAMTLAGEYAYAGREWVVETVRRILCAKTTDIVHNHHNFAWLEQHGDRELWVVRKGATPAFPGQRGFVGGSMGDNAVILSGVESEEGAASLYSTVHGAGRVMSRTEARGRSVKDPATGKRMRMQGRVRHDEMQAWLREKGVHLIGGDLDEAPQAYRRLPEVLAQHAGTIRVEHTLRPFLVVMAGADVFDPFKD